MTLLCIHQTGYVCFDFAQLQLHLLSSVTLYLLYPNLDFPCDYTSTWVLMKAFTKAKTSFYVDQRTQKLQEQIPENPPKQPILYFIVWRTDFSTVIHKGNSRKGCKMGALATCIPTLQFQLYWQHYMSTAFYYRGWTAASDFQHRNKHALIIFHRCLLSLFSMFSKERDCMGSQQDIPVSYLFHQNKSSKMYPVSILLAFNPIATSPTHQQGH